MDTMNTSMKTLTNSARTLLLVGLLTLASAPLFSQQLEPLQPPRNQNQVTATNGSPGTDTPTSPAFSADKYERTVKITPDGKLVILSENRSRRLARSAEGQIRVEDISIDEECQKSAQSQSTCSSSYITLFEPATQTITHWGERSNNAHGSVVFPISASQAAEILEDTTSMPDESGSDNTGDDPEGATLTTQNLGQKTIEGISATGLRTTSTLPARARGNKDTIITTHEVWTSTDMNLVVKVIDTTQTGDNLNKKGTIRGLEHVSLSPDPTLFHPPDDYEHQDWRVTNPGKPIDWGAKNDMPQYAAWFVK